MADPDAPDRLSAAYGVEVDQGTKNRHIAETIAAIRTVPPAPVPTGFALRRRVAGAAAVVLAVVAPVGMAVAAEDAVPGDFLYPMKQVTERVRGVVDNDIAATHRVEEAERLVVRGASVLEITRAVERAEAATSDLVEDGTLGPRLETIRERLRQPDEHESGPVEAPSQSGQPDPPGSGPGNADRNGEANGSGAGSATTSVPRSAGQSESAEGRSPGSSSTPDESPPPDGNGETEPNRGDGGTAGRGDGAGVGGESSPQSTVRQGSGGAGGS